MDNEIWKSAESLGYSKYECSNMGRIRNIKRNSILDGSTTSSGYKMYGLRNDKGKQTQKLCHDLIIKLFIGPKESEEQTADHINRIRHDNKVTNLRWASPKQQANNSFKPLKIKGRQIYQYDLNMNLIKKWNKICDIVNSPYTSKLSYNSIISACKNNKIYDGCRWRYADDVDIDTTEEWKLVP